MEEQLRRYVIRLWWNRLRAAFWILRGDSVIHNVHVDYGSNELVLSAMDPVEGKLLLSTSNFNNCDLKVETGEDE